MRVVEIILLVLTISVLLLILYGLFLFILYFSVVSATENSNKSYTTITTVDSHIAHYKHPLWCGKGMCGILDVYKYYIYDSSSHSEYKVTDSKHFDVVSRIGVHNVSIVYGDIVDVRE